MNLLDRLKELEAKIDPAHDDEIRCSAGWPEYIAEVEKALPKLRAFVDLFDKWQRLMMLQCLGKEGLDDRTEQLYKDVLEARKALDQP